MKNRLILTAAILVLPAVWLSAQSFNLVTEVNSGLWVHFNDKEDSDTYLQVAGCDNVPVRINLKGKFDSADEIMGFYFNLRGQARNTIEADGKPRLDPNRNNNLSEILYFEKVRAYAKFFNGLVTFIGGSWEAEEYETPGGLSSTIGMNGAGLIMDVSPIPGLDIMLSGWAKEGDTTLINEAQYFLTGIYQKPDLFKIMGHFATHQYGVTGFSKDSDENHYGPYGTSSYNEIRAKDQRIIIGGSYMGLGNYGFTKLGLDARMYNLGGARTPSEDGARLIKIYPFAIGQKITYKWNNLTLDARIRQSFRLGDDRYNYAPAFRFRVLATWNMDDTLLGCGVIPKLGFNYFLNSDPWGDNPTDMRFDEAVLDWEQCTRENGGYGISPAVEFRVGKTHNALLELGYSLKVNTGKPDDDMLITEKSAVNHAFYIFVKVTGVGKLDTNIGKAETNVENYESK